MSLRLATWIALSACGRYGFEPPSTPDAPDDAAPAVAIDWNLGAFTPPRVVVPLSPSPHDHAASMTGDLLEVVFESRSTGNDDPWHAIRASSAAPWDPPRRLDELATDEIESAFQISADGRALSFTRGSTLYATWRAARTDPWQPPEPSPFVALAGGRHLYNASPTPSLLATVVQADSDVPGDSNLYLSVRRHVDDGWGPLQPLPGINTTFDEMKGHISDDLRFLYFASDRPGGQGTSFDIYFAQRASPDEPFGRIELVVELSATDMDNDPWVSADGHVILYSSYRDSNEGWALYEARR
jgi:hypothetical protein